MAERQLPAEFKEFIKYLNKNRVRYLLIGGWAVGIHSNPRLTIDINFLIGVDDKNIEKLISALKDFGIKNVPPEFFKIEDNTFRIGRSPLRIDILNMALGIEFEKCYKRKQIVKLDGILVKLISRNDLIASKLAAHREKDLADVRELKRIRPSPRASF
jgi:predicted nucleotidyltransferase